MTSLADLVAPCGVEEFLGTVWGRQTRVFPGDADRAAHLLPWPALNELLRRNRLEEPRLRLAADGVRVPVEEYTELVTPRRGAPYRRLSQADMAENLRAGATLVVDSIDELYPAIDELAADLERVLRERVQVNMYGSFGPTKGFATHWDDHDVLAIQVHGRKHWRVFGPTRDFPTRRDVEQPTPPEGAPAHDFVLTAGDVLHVPRGWWHDANALDEPSLHLTFGITSATGVDFATWVAEELRRHALARQDLPRFADAEVRRQRAKELAELLSAELAAPDVLDRFFYDRDSTAPARSWGGLPWSVRGDLPSDGGLAVRLLAPRAALSTQGETVRLAADSQVYTFAAPATPILRALLDGAPKSIAELTAASDGLAESTVRGLCAELVRLGVATADH